MTGTLKRANDAIFLWESGRHDSAFLIALVAVAATARKRYPNLKNKDRECFVKFVSDSSVCRIIVEFRGQCHPVAHIFYKWLRCEFIHEGELPVDIQFMTEDDPNFMSIRAGGAPEYILKIGHGWFHQMIGSVKMAPENLTKM